MAAPAGAEPTGSVITLARPPRRRASEPVGRASGSAVRPVPPATAAPARPESGRGHRFDLTEAYDTHGAQLFGFAVNALGDRGAAEDCVQETFLRAWRARDRYDPERASARTWLFAITRNVIRDAMRSRQRRPLPVEAEQLNERATRDADPVERLRMLEALATLSREHRQVVVAIHLVGMSYAELSEAIAVPVPTLRTRAFYALRAMRRELAERED